MLNAFKHYRSLNFLKHTNPVYQNQVTQVHAECIMSVSITNTSSITAITTTGFNSQLNNFLDYFNSVSISDS